MREVDGKGNLIIILKPSNKLPSKPGNEGAVKGGNKSFPGPRLGLQRKRLPKCYRPEGQDRPCVSTLESFLPLLRNI